MPYGVCKVCGCTDNDPCFHPEHGNCWWADETHELCSHYADPKIANSPEVRHCINTTDTYNPDNVGEKLHYLMSEPMAQNFWIDMESGVRTDDEFDIDKVLKVLCICKEVMREFNQK